MNVANNPNHPICRATRCYSGVTGAVIAGVAVAATAYAASEQAGAQRDSNRTNTRNAQLTNDLNYNVFRETRGEGGTSILPLYATRMDQPFEPELFADVLDVYDSTGAMTPEQQLAAYQEISAGFDPALAGSRATVNALFDGGLEAEARTAQEPVAAARLAMAESKKNSALEALAQTISEIKSISARKGFTGDSFGERLLDFNARRVAYNEGAMATGAANLENATDLRNIKNAAIAMRVGNVGLPYQQRRVALSDADAAETALVDRTSRRTSLFQPFRIGPGSFRYAPLPPVGPVASTGQIVGQAVGAGAGALGNYYVSRPQPGAPGTGAPSTGPYYGPGYGPDYDAYNSSPYYGPGYS